MRFIYCQLFTTPRELHAIAARKRSQVHGHWCTVFIKNVPHLEGTCWSKIAFPIEEADDTNITLHLAALKQLQQTIRETDEKKWEKKGSFPLTEQSQSPSTWPSPSLSNSCFTPSQSFLSEHGRQMMVTSSPANCDVRIKHSFPHKRGATACFYALI